MVFDPNTGLPVNPPVPSGPSPITVNMPPQAQPGPATPPPGYLSQEQVNEMLAQARREEKDKLYPQLQEFGEKVKTLEEKEAEREQQRLAAEQQAAEAERLRQEAEMSAAERLQREVQEANSRWEQQFAQMNQEREAERALIKKEAEFADLSRYKYDRLQLEADSIAPQFADLVRGNTREEIDASIEVMKSKTNEIMEQVFQGQQQQVRQLAPPITGAPSTDPSVIAGTQEQTVTLTAEQIAAMPIEEYSAMRGQILGAASAHVREKGAYAP